MTEQETDLAFEDWWNAEFKDHRIVVDSVTMTTWKRIARTAWKAGFAFAGRAVPPGQNQA